MGHTAVKWPTNHGRTVPFYQVMVLRGSQNQSKTIKIYIISGSCSCTDYVNPTGYGQCKKSNPAVFDNKVLCYVNLPSTCTDKLPTKDQDKWFSHEACLTDGK